MLEKVTLTLEELYFLGKQMNAKYMNYAYISAMPDISQRRGLYEVRCIDGLMGKGYLEEDFFGEIIIDQELKDFLHPVFFGEKQISMEQINVPAVSGKIIYLHEKEREMRKAWLENTLIHLENLPVEKRIDFFYSFLPDEIIDHGEKRVLNARKAESGFRGNNDTRLFDKILYIKAIVVGKSMIQRTICFQNEKCYCKDDAGERYAELSREEYLIETERIINMEE